MKVATRMKHTKPLIQAIGILSLFIIMSNQLCYGSSIQLNWNKPAAINYLTRRTSEWLTWPGAARGSGSACISCHTSMPLALALSTLYNASSGGNAEIAENSLVKNVKMRVQNWNTISSLKPVAIQCYYGDKQYSSLGTESVMNALVLVNYSRESANDTLSPVTKKSLEYLWQQEQPDGSWKWLNFGLSPWENNNIYYGTALAAMAVGMAGKNYYTQPDLKSKLFLMRQYLNIGYPQQRLHDKVVYMLASTWLPGLMNRTSKLALIQQLYTLQKPDGGWSLQDLGSTPATTAGWGGAGIYPSTSLSDGYATGLIVLTLKREGVSVNNPVLRKALLWLTSHENNGTWPANYINGSRDPHSMTGKFMRDAASAFAVMALNAR